MWLFKTYNIKYKYGTDEILEASTQSATTTYTILTTIYTK